METPIGDLLTLVNGRAFKPEEWNGDIESGLPIIIQNLNNPLAPYNYYCGDVEEKYIVNKGMLLFGPIKRIIVRSSHMERQKSYLESTYLYRSS